MADFKKLKNSKVQFSITITEDELKKSHNAVVQDVKTNTAVKGFRKGHAPDEKVIAQVGLHNIAREALNAVIEKKYIAFISENKLQPITAPHIKGPEKPATDGEPMVIEGEVEIFPSVEVKGYEKIKAHQVEVEIKSDEIDSMIKDVLVQMNQTQNVKRAAIEGDNIEVDFRGKDKEGKTLDKTEGKNMPITLGQGQFLEDLEKAYIGMKPGDEKKDVSVKFPKDYPADDFAGKTIKFDIALQSVKEADPKSLTKETLLAITGKETTEKEFRKQVEGMIRQKKEGQAFQEAVGKYQEQLAKLVKADLPISWIENEIQTRMQQMQASGQPIENEAKLKKELAKGAEVNLKAFLGLSEIIQKEKIELNKDEEAFAKQRIDQKLQDKPNANKEQALAQEILHMKIDKYLRSLMISEEKR